MIRMRLGSTVDSRPAACRKKGVRGGKIRLCARFRDGPRGAGCGKRKSHAETRTRREPVDKPSGMDIPFTEDGVATKVAPTVSKVTGGESDDAREQARAATGHAARVAADDGVSPAHRPARGRVGRKGRGGGDA